MHGFRASSSWRPRAAVSNQVAAVSVVMVVLLAVASGYLLFLRPASTASSTNTTQGAPGSSPSNAISAFALYNYYNLGPNATDYPQLTGHTIYARGNITSIVNSQSSAAVETQVATPANAFEYWEFVNGTGLPAIAQNQPIVAHCFVQGLVQQRNGTKYLYLNSCSAVLPAH